MRFPFKLENNKYDARKFEDSARAFLARGETRLSTMHRVAGVFVSGAGLLTIVPFLLKDAISDIITKIPNDFYIACAPLYIFLLTSVGIGIYSLKCLFKDLVLFYFSPTHEAENSTAFLPRFALSALAIPLATNNQDNEENNEKIKTIRAEINLKQEGENETDYGFFEFLLPRGKPNSYSNTNILANLTQQHIYPATRENQIRKTDRSTPKDRHINACLALMGMAGLRDRTLLEEVARMEVSLTRHANSLRKLVLRYFKSVLLLGTRLLFIFAIVFIEKKFLGADEYVFANYLLKKIQPQTWQLQSTYTLSYIIFFVTAVSTPHILRFPLKWIYKELGLDSQLMNRATADNDISLFERRVFYVTIFETFCAIFGFFIVLNNQSFIKYTLWKEDFIFYILLIFIITVICTTGYSLGTWYYFLHRAKKNEDNKDKDFN